jgi:hypothetical protein
MKKKSPSLSLHGQARGASMAGEPPTPYPATRSQSPRTAQPMPLHRTEGESEKEMTDLPPAGLQNHGRNHRSTLATPPAQKLHVPSVADSRDPGKAGPQVNGGGRFRAGSEGSPENERPGPREQDPGPDRTATIKRSGKRTVDNMPHHQNERL